MRGEIKSLILISIFGALTAIGTFIKIPIPFVSDIWGCQQF
ncbi:hypothetical protein [Clostridium sp. Marseille-Q7071]